MIVFQFSREYVRVMWSSGVFSGNLYIGEFAVAEEREVIVIVHAVDDQLGRLDFHLKAAGYDVKAYTSINSMRGRWLSAADGPPRVIIFGEGCTNQELDVLNYLRQKFSLNIPHISIRNVGRSMATDFAGQFVCWPSVSEILSVLRDEVLSC